MKVNRILALFLLIISSSACDSGENTADDPAPADTVDIYIDDAATAVDAPEISDRYNFKTYQNSRFNYCVSYPVEVFRMQEAAQNADGRKFTGKNNISMSVYGYNNALGHSVEEAMQWEIKNAPPQKITGKEVHPEYYVLKGIENDKMFYERSYRLDDNFATIRFEYPQEREQEILPIMDSILHDFPKCNRNI